MRNVQSVHGQRSIRLRGHDYSSQGAYFVTICSHHREFVFGEIVQEEARLNETGNIVREEWLKTEEVRPSVDLDDFVVMPNHIHGILIIKDEPVGAIHRIAPTRPERRLQPGSLGAIIGQFKSIATKRINKVRGTPGAVVWQRNFYEHVVRDDEDLNRIREYIAANPANWILDDQNPQMHRSEKPDD